MSSPSLLFHRGQIPVYRAFQSRFIEHDRMQGLRKAAYSVERGLSDIPDFC